jgi:hypothetical protein
VLLGVIALRPYASPDAVAHAQGAFAGVQFSGEGGTYDFFDTRTGEVYDYDDITGLQRHVRLMKLGAPLVRVK